MLRLFLFYPRGREEEARSFFGQLMQLPRLAAMMPVTDPREWVAYDADERAVDQLAQVLLPFSLDGAADGEHACFLLLPSGGEAQGLRGLRLLLRVRWWARCGGVRFLGAVPLHAVASGAFGRQLPSVAARLLVQTGGMPWMPLRQADTGGDLVAGFTVSLSGAGGRALCAATFYDDPARGCFLDLYRLGHNFGLFLQSHLNLACEAFAARHEGRAPQRLVVCCHARRPVDRLVELVSQTTSGTPELPVVLVQVRRTVRGELRHYDPSAPHGMPPAGTVVRTGEGVSLLFCRDARLVSDTGRTFFPLPLEVRTGRLCADGSLTPLPPAEDDALLVQLFRLVRGNTADAEGNALPLVLSHADGLLRQGSGELWLKREVD